MYIRILCTVLGVGDVGSLPSRRARADGLNISVGGNQLASIIVRTYCIFINIHQLIISLPSWTRINAIQTDSLAVIGLQSLSTPVLIWVSRLFLSPGAQVIYLTTGDNMISALTEKALLVLLSTQAILFLYSIQTRSWQV